MSLIEEMEQGWLDHDKEFRVRLASVTDYIGPEFTAGLFAALEIVFILGGADMLRVLVHRNMLNDDILTGRECSAPGFLDSGLKVITSTRPRPARRNRVALGLDSDSRTSPASTVRCTSA